MHMTLYEKIEQCLHAGAATDTESYTQLLLSLADPDWQARYAAAVALGDRPDPAAIPALLAALDIEDAAPLFAQPEEFGGIPAGANTPFRIAFPEGTLSETIAAWERRGRIKQAVCWTLGSIGVADPRVLQRLHRYAVDQQQDYSVRAAACLALGQIGDPSSRAVLEGAREDQEWCTKTEAERALARIIHEHLDG